MLKGHGVYKEIPSEKDFFDEIKNSKRAVVHFYRPTTDRCTIFDKHLEPCPVNGCPLNPQSGVN